MGQHHTACQLLRCRLWPSKAAHKPETSELNIAHLKVTLIISAKANFGKAIYFAL